MSTALPPDTILQGRYRIVRLIGLGGMGAVYLTEDLHLKDERFALKELTYSPDADAPLRQQLRGQFRREATALSNLDHPNLPKVFDYFSEDGRDYLVMDYVEGPDLKETLDEARAEGHNLPEAQVLEWADQICGALVYLHGQDPPIIHRDIKPANLKLPPSGVVKLVDFGLVKFFDAKDPRTLTLVHAYGTPTYAPLEQYAGGAGGTDVRSDIYSLGATLYHLLTGRAPADAHRRFMDPQSLSGPRTLNPQISPLTEYLILKAMAIRPDDRYQSVHEMRRDLAMARHLSLPRRTQRGLALVWSSLRPHKWLSLAVLILLVLAILITALGIEPLV
ncbi:MAG: serine/threonine protein kinase [Anaerolineae bacterium]|nr:serine/threonine protein kinase [Anaerolineae bacterium]